MYHCIPSKFYPLAFFLYNYKLIYMVTFLPTVYFLVMDSAQCSICWATEDSHNLSPLIPHIYAYSRTKYQPRKTQYVSCPQDTALKISDLEQPVLEQVSEAVYYIGSSETLFLTWFRNLSDKRCHVAHYQNTKCTKPHLVMTTQHAIHQEGETLYCIESSSGDGERNKTGQSW
jgi:hypothetical protein